MCGCVVAINSVARGWIRRISNTSYNGGGLVLYCDCPVQAEFPIKSIWNNIYGFSFTSISKYIFPNKKIIKIYTVPFYSEITPFLVTSDSDNKVFIV